LVTLWSIANSPVEWMTNTQKAFSCGVFFFIAFSCIYLPSTLMMRPHPMFWKFCLSLQIFYAACLTFFFILPLSETRQALKFFDASLGVELPEVSYADDCRIFTPENPESSMANIYFAVFDCHFVAHFLGWFGKMLIMRDWWIVWACSIIFEFLEITFRYWLPNFWECWWDHLFLDVFGCNLLGSILGALFIRKFSVTKINWVCEPQNETDQSC
jgi:phosphatidylserine synthase 2